MTRKLETRLRSIEEARGETSEALRNEDAHAFRQKITGIIQRFDPGDADLPESTRKASFSAAQEMAWRLRFCRGQGSL